MGKVNMSRSSFAINSAHYLYTWHKYTCYPRSYAPPPASHRTPTGGAPHYLRTLLGKKGFLLTNFAGQFHHPLEGESGVGWNVGEVETVVL